MANRTDIVACARKYVTTPFAHQGRRSGHSLDCVGLVMCVGEDLGVVGAAGVPITRDLYIEYGPQPQGHEVLDACRKHLVRKMTNEMRAGDIVCMRIPVDPTHVGIISERNGELYIIHAYEGNIGKCVEHILDNAWRRRIVMVFEFPGTTD